MPLPSRRFTERFVSGRWRFAIQAIDRTDRGATSSSSGSIHHVFQKKAVPAGRGGQRALQQSRVLKLFAINVLMGLLCPSLGTGNGCTTWNYKLLNVPGFSAGTEIVLVLRWLTVHFLHVVPLDSKSASSLQQVPPATRVCMCQGRMRERGFGTYEGVCSSELLLEMTNDYRYSFCNIPEITCKCRRGPQQFLHFARSSLCFFSS